MLPQKAMNEVDTLRVINEIQTYHDHIWIPIMQVEIHSLNVLEIHVNGLLILKCTEQINTNKILTLIFL